VDLQRVADEVSSHEGNIWTHIISLRREDAERLGYDKGTRWQDLLREKAETFAKNMSIEDVRDFKWYAAFHDESHHPHVHMIAYSQKPNQGYLRKQGITNIKSALAADIFRHDLMHIYSEQTKHRNDLTAESKAVMADIISRINQDVYDNEKVEQLLTVLSKRLAHVKGRKQYARLSADVKDMIKTVVDELSSDSRIAELYDLWYEKRFDVLRTYKTNMPDKLPLSEQKEFKNIKNIVMAEALHLGHGDFTFEDDVQITPNEASEELPDDDFSDDFPLADDSDTSDLIEYYAGWTDAYQKARLYLYGKDDIKQDFEKAYALMSAEAEKGNAFALFDTGRMHRDGLGREKKPEEAQSWFGKAYQGFISVLPTLEKTDYIQYRIGKMYAQGLGIEQSYESAADWYQQSVAQGNPFAAYALGSLHYRGKGVDQDYERALRLYTMAAGHEKRPNVFAMYELGKMYRDGIGTAKNPEASASWFTSAYEGFVPLEKSMPDDKLQYRLGQMNLTGTGTAVNLVLAQEYFEKSAALNNLNAMYGLGKLYSDRSFENYNPQKAVHWLFEASKENHQYAQYALGKLFLKGEHIKKDIPFALRQLEAAAEQGNGHALYLLGKTYMKGEDLPKDMLKAIEYLTAAIEQGEDINHWALYALGKAYLEIGDTDKAYEMLTASAEQENEHAQYLLGKLLFKGEVFPQDIPRAIELLTASAGQGNQFAAYQLGKLYLTEGAYKNVQEAVRYLEQAAHHDTPNQWALYSLGKLYLYGSDVTRDEEKAVRYLTASAEQGNPFAQSLLSTMQKSRVRIASLRLLHQMAKLLQEKGAGRNGKPGLVERKLRRKIDEKKAALGLRL